MQGGPVRVALIGAGVVGSSVAQLLTEHADDLAARVGRPLELVGIGVRRAGRARSGCQASTRRCSPPTPPSWSPAPTSSSRSIGGIEPARSLILRAMEHGASVVTANKALLAEDGPTLYAAAARHGVDLYYEAAVAGGIPLLRPLREIARRRLRAQGHRHRQRHDELRPGQDGHHRRRASPTR
jgi:homoserine dehydrogenase